MVSLRVKLTSQRVHYRKGCTGLERCAREWEGRFDLHPVLIYASIIIPIPSKLALHCSCTRMNVEFNYWSIELLSFSMMNFPGYLFVQLLLQTIAIHRTISFEREIHKNYPMTRILQSEISLVDKFGNISSTAIYSIARSSNLWHSAGRQRACLEFISRFITLLTFFFSLLLLPPPLLLASLARFEYWPYLVKQDNWRWPTQCYSFFSLFSFFTLDPGRSTSGRGLSCLIPKNAFNLVSYREPSFASVYVSLLTGVRQASI